jgi:hypothetical protein
MAGLDPAIHVFSKKKGVDARDVWREDALCAFAGHDEGIFVATQIFDIRDE